MGVSFLDGSYNPYTLYKISYISTQFNYLNSVQPRSDPIRFISFQSIH